MQILAWPVYRIALSMAAKGLNHTVEHLFRKEYGKLVALLTNRFGASHLEQIEDVTQDTFLKAMKLWGYQEVPDNPTAWLYRVASNGLLDKFRKEGRMDLVSDDFQFPEKGENTLNEISLENIQDSQLRMIFACCHPNLSQEHQIILSLKLMGGFSNKELADALLKKEEAVAKSFTRAKKSFREKVKMIQIPVQMGLQTRLFQVLKVIYLLFSEGYSATTGTQFIKRDICHEAMRLALLLRENKYCKHPNLEALLALMCFHASRFDARINLEGQLVSLEHHDRNQYNQELIQIGTFHLECAGDDDMMPSQYHLEAARSFYHSTAKRFEETDWKNILQLYDFQLKQQFSPMIALNRIVPFEKVHGAEKALKALNELSQKTDFEDSGLFYAIKAGLLRTLQKKSYESTLEKAIALTENELVKQYLRTKLD
ncbi:MAG: sigma-70 family RNA polymerase sigma factor [Bacteroidota bacterium]